MQCRQASVEENEWSFYKSAFDNFEVISKKSCLIWHILGGDLSSEKQVLSKFVMYSFQSGSMADVNRELDHRAVFQNTSHQTFKETFSTAVSMICLLFLLLNPSSRKALLVISSICEIKEGSLSKITLRSLTVSRTLKLVLTKAYFRSTGLIFLGNLTTLHF